MQWMQWMTRARVWHKINRFSFIDFCARVINIEAGVAFYMNLLAIYAIILIQMNRGGIHI